MLEAVGLSTREITVYQALMTRPGTDAAGLAAGCALAEAEVAVVLLRLVQDGLAVQSGRPARYEAAAPDVALAELIGRQEERLNTARHEMHRLAQLFRDCGTAGDAGAVEVVSGGAAVSARVDRLYESADTRVRSFDRPPYAQHPAAGSARRGAAGRASNTAPSTAGTRWPGRAVSSRTSSPAAPPGSTPGCARTCRPSS